MNVYLNDPQAVIFEHVRVFRFFLIITMTEHTVASIVYCIQVNWEFGRRVTSLNIAVDTQNTKIEPRVNTLLLDLGLF